MLPCCTPTVGMPRSADAVRIGIDHLYISSPTTTTFTSPEARNAQRS
jgi:hypothetical protein